MQHTLKNTISINGIGLHTGKDVQLNIHPAEADHGIIFKRVDIQDKNNLIPAKWNHVVDTRLCSVIGNDDGVTVGTIEHLMAALRGCGIDNALVEIDAAEVPILDGSSAIFVEAIDEVGVQVQSQPRRAIRILKEVTYQDGDRKVTLSPSSIPVYGGQIDYANPAIGSQRFEIKLVNGNFRHDLADCRTFCLLQDVEMMQKNGLALGGSLDNAVVVDDNGIMNGGGLRCHDEFIRHKLLDAIGDIALAGGLVLGAYEGVRAGHEMNNKALRALFADDSAWEMVDLFVEMEENDSWIYHTKPRATTVSIAS
ncbi:MAG TPA: UDP-3-O-acyl-N-acetylglucosamine deacetylase [Alphaproteobacteria bacterium]|nr:UDP-3-O-acyl-N-acetylglucosamine deacetylase [Alphaproteobacteria bacterium]